MSDLVGNPNCWFCHAQARSSIENPHDRSDFLLLEIALSVYRSEEASREKNPCSQVIDVLGELSPNY